MGRKNNKNFKALSKIITFNRINFFIKTLFLILPLALLSLCAYLKAPNYSYYFLLEMSPIAWIHSLMLYSIGLVALGIFINQFQKVGVKSYYWLVWFLGFCYLSLDERFAIHERIRDHLLKTYLPHLPLMNWTGAGDYFLVILLVLGIVFLWKFTAQAVDDKKTLKIMWAAIGVTIVAVGIDAANFEAWGIPFLKSEQVVEEFLETAAFFLYFWFVFDNYLFNINARG
jgi:hypothetical protein